MEYPLWLQVILALCMGLALAGLGAWMLFTTATRAMRAAAALEDRRSHKETEALNNWKALFEEERQERLEAVAELVSENMDLRKHCRNMEDLLDRVPASVLKKIREEAKNNDEV